MSIMRPVCVFAEVPAAVRAQVMGLLHGRWRTATRLIMVLLSAAGMSAAEIADLLDYHPATVRRWLHRSPQKASRDCPTGLDPADPRWAAHP